jgi:hypothetical protein
VPHPTPGSSRTLACSQASACVCVRCRGEVHPLLAGFNRHHHASPGQVPHGVAGGRAWLHALAAGQGADLAFFLNAFCPPACHAQDSAAENSHGHALIPDQPDVVAGCVSQQAAPRTLTLACLAPRQAEWRAKAVHGGGQRITTQHSAAPQNKAHPAVPGNTAARAPAKKTGSCAIPGATWSPQRT